LSGALSLDSFKKSEASLGAGELGREEGAVRGRERQFGIIQRLMCLLQLRLEFGELLG